MEHVKDHLEIILSVSLKFYGVEPIKYIVDQKIKKYIVLMEKVYSEENLKSIVIG